jgi:hypothetical protein
MGDVHHATFGPADAVSSPDRVWVGDSGEARVRVSGIIGESRARRLDRELRRLEGRALLLVLDLSHVLGAHPAALVAIGTAGRRAERERRRMWVVPPEPSLALLTDDGLADAPIGFEDLRRWLDRSGLTLVAVEEARATPGALRWRTT